MNALDCRFKDINAGQQLESKIFTIDENKVSLCGTQLRCKCLILGGGDGA